jgi:hypothetical protein
MRALRLLGGLMATLAALASLGAGAEPGGDPELEHNARLLEVWRADPVHYERLRQDLRAFYRLPPEKRERMRQLYRGLQDQDPVTRQRLWDVLNRYADWLERLPAEERQQIEAAPDRAARLEVIRRLREQQWISRLPARVREELQALPDEERPAFLAKLRDEERARRRRFLHPESLPPNPRPGFLAEFPREVREFVDNDLRPTLTADERRQLDAAEGKWPLLAHTIWDLAERHPYLPPLPNGPVRGYKDLPKEVKDLYPPRRLQRHWAGLQSHEGKWPDYALAFTAVMHGEKGRVISLGASRPADFAPATRQFLELTLLPKLSERERDQLQALEGKWPDYPRQLHELARRYNLSIPGMSLPGPQELWESARTALPEVPDHDLRAFALTELSAEERKALNLSPNDPESRDRLRQEYFRKHPQELHRLRHPEHRPPAAGNP